MTAPLEVFPGESTDSIAIPSGPSATSAKTPGAMKLAGDASHPLAGIENVARPIETSVGLRPVEWWTAGGSVP